MIDNKMIWCATCRDLLEDKPIIHVADEGYNNYYCYSCAKKLVSYLEMKYKEESKKEYDENIKKYSIEEEKTRIWSNKKRKFDWEMMKERFYFMVLPITALTYIIQDSQMSDTISIFVLSSLFLFFVDIDSSTFDKENPKPSREFILPPKLKRKKVSHHSIQFDYYHSNKKYRRYILLRDDYTCQWCLEKYDADYLEVHHIIPRSQNGNNHPANLVTLCIDCHKNEEWYGHHHKYKYTTSKKQMLNRQ